jgi:DUF1365 family protein
VAASCIYEGHIRHRRLGPVAHTFTYRAFLMYVDLEELPALFRDRWLWSADRPALASLRRTDHLGDPAEPLEHAVRTLVHERVGRRLEGPIRLLTNLRYFGYCFNPVSFFYCYDASGQRVETIVAEVHNTPWGEMHPYVLDRSHSMSAGSRQRFRFKKVFHVSPFMDMNVDYDWRFVHPGEQLVVHMENQRDGARFFDATMTMVRREITGVNLARVLCRYPLMTAKVSAAIYYQALRLWMKRAPFHPHPGTAPEEVT